MLLKSRTLAHLTTSVRNILEDIKYKSLRTEIDLKYDYAPELLATEIKLQDAEIPPGTIVTLMFDTRIRPADALNLISRLVIATSRGKVLINKLLIHLGFLTSSLDYSQILNKIKHVFNKRHIHIRGNIGI